MIEIISIVVCLFTKKQLKKDQTVDLKMLEIINSITLICLVFFRVVSVLCFVGIRLELLVVTAILILVYIHNIKILRKQRKGISIYCNNCGMSIKSSDLFCEECGYENEFYEEV